jgi:hypothetical protein
MRTRVLAPTMPQATLEEDECSKFEFTGGAGKAS